MSQPLTWGDFESLIQIGVTMNGAYYTVMQFTPPFIIREKAILEALIKEAHLYDIRHVFPDDPEFNFPDQFLSIVSDMNLRERTNRKVLESIRVVAIVSFLLGLGLLGYSSFNAPDPIPPIGRWIAVSFVIPVLAGALYMGGVSVLRYSPARQTRKNVEASMRAACLEYRGRNRQKN